MSAPTAEKRKTSPAKRVEIFQRERDRRQAKLEEVTAELAELKARRQDAVTEALRGDPTKSAFGLGKAPSEGDRKIVELEKTAGHLETEIVSLQAELNVAAAELAERHLGEAILRMRKLAEEERDVMVKAGTLLASLAKPWAARVGLLEDRRSLVESVRSESLPQTAASRPDLVSRYEEAVSTTLAPQAVSFEGFVLALLEAALADRPDVEAELKHVDELNARRREMARRAPGSSDDLPMVPKPVIQVDPLYELVPDLRDQVRSFDPTIAARPDEGEIEGLAESGFGVAGESLAYGADGGLRLPWRRSPGGEAA